MKTKVHRLNVDEGHLTVDEKTSWPDIVNVYIPRHIVVNLLARLTSSLQSADDKGIKVTFMGKFDYDIEEKV